MNENSKESRLISGDGPVNLRTVDREQLGDLTHRDTVSPEAIARAERSHARCAIGASLEEQVRSSQAPVHQAPQALQIIFSVLLACGLVTGLLAWLQASMGLGAAACGLLIVGSLGSFVGVRRKSSRGETTGLAAPAPIFDKSTLRAFDDVLEAAAPELSPAAGSCLRQLKTSLAHVASHATRSDEHFTQDDRMFLVESLRRYIPDTLEAYLRIPSSQRNQALLPGAASAEEALVKQLALLQDEIDSRAKKIGRSAAEDLLKQQRFLESKKTR